MLPRRTLLLIALAALAIGPPASSRLWTLSGSAIRPVPIPPGDPVPVLLQGDMDGQPGSENLSLEDGRLVILTGDVIRWESPGDWQVRQAELADLNRDGVLEVVLLVWRPFKPWPVDAWLPHGGRISGFHDASGMSCHLILIGWLRDAFLERWAGSALADPVKQFAVFDPDGSGRQFLVTLESAYNDPPSQAGRRLKVWEWNGFGFTAVSTQEGPFHQFSILQVENRQALYLVP